MRIYRCVVAAACLGFIATLTGCGGHSSPIPAASESFSTIRALTTSSKIHHVVIIFQENRSFDNMFNGFPGTNTVTYGYNSQGQKVPLRQITLTAPWDLDHTHFGFENDYNDGAMNGFNKNPGFCYGLNRCLPGDIRAYGIVPRAESAPYFTMAKRFTVADDMFQTNEGPSFPAHQYIVSGTSTITNGSSYRAADNPVDPAGFANGGCDSPAGSLVPLIDPNGVDTYTAYPCFDRISLMELLDAKSLTWRYYQAIAGAGIWNGPDAILKVRRSRQFATDVVAPPQQVLKDIPAGRLADVTWVTPDSIWSDHAHSNNGSGPSWVAAVVNAIGKSSYWDDTALFVTWDDWGGWYDHVKPPQYNSYELGFRVPLIVISPYAKTNYVSHRQHEFGSILKFTEEVFGLPSMHTTDERADDLSDCFDFNQSPTKFKPIPAPYRLSYFINHTPDGQNPDDDASHYALLYSFGAHGKFDDGRSPVARVVALGSAMYGTTQAGGTTNKNCSGGCGTLYKAGASGGETVLYRFAGGNDGAVPAAGLISSSGVLFGTTSEGGGGGTCNGGCGTVFEFDRATKTETPIYRFAGGPDGAYPVAGLVAVNGSLYGTTQYGGHTTRLCPQGCGTVFELDPNSGTEKVVHAFAGGSDGAFPLAGLIAYNGALYGTTMYGGSTTGFCTTGCGTVFAIGPTSGVDHVVYRFRYSPKNGDGANPMSGLIESNGDLFGTTYDGGSASRGTVFSLTTSGGEHVLHSFDAGGKGDGVYPYDALIAYNGGFYGTTHAGGASGRGAVFSITYAGQENVVYSFAGPPDDGAYVTSSLTAFDGMLFGTTAGGGAESEGTIFKVAP